jgi:hypothetical protein
LVTKRQKIFPNKGPTFTQRIPHCLGYRPQAQHAWRYPDYPDEICGQGQVDQTLRGALGETGPGSELYTKELVVGNVALTPFIQEEESVYRITIPRELTEVSL